jgi:hypothetical protein
VKLSRRGGFSDFVILDHEWRVRESVVDATNSHEGVGRDGATRLDVGEARVEDEFDTIADERDRVLVSRRDHGARMKFDQAFDDSAAMVLGLVTAPLDLG